jgi:hypothetical protein
MSFVLDPTQAAMLSGDGR